MLRSLKNRFLLLLLILIRHNGIPYIDTSRTNFMNPHTLVVVLLRSPFPRSLSLALCDVCVLYLLFQSLYWTYCSSAFFFSIFFSFHSFFHCMPFPWLMRWAVAALPCSRRHCMRSATLSRSSWSSDFFMRAHQLIPTHGVSEWERENFQSQKTVSFSFISWAFFFSFGLLFHFIWTHVFFFL